MVITRGFDSRDLGSIPSKTFFIIYNNNLLSIITSYQNQNHYSVGYR